MKLLSTRPVGIRPTYIALTALAATALWTLMAGPLLADDWPQFRGPNCSGISQGTASLPAEFSDSQHVQWKADVGEGIGSPVVAAGRVFISGMLAGETAEGELPNYNQVALFAYDLKTGQQLWKRTWETEGLPDIHATNSHASTTAAADADRVYFYFSTIGLVALDAKSGEDVWQQKLPTPFFVFKWGAGMSPILYKNMVIFCQDDDLNPAMYAFDKKTGEQLWKDDRRDMAVNYSHPVICETDHGDEIVVAGTGLLIGYDPQTGRRRWFARTLLRNIKTTPVSRNGIVYIALQSAGIANQWLASADRADTGNSDGKLTKEEIQAFVGKQQVPEEFYRRTFDRGDRNKDGELEGEELDLAFLDPDNFAGARFDAENVAAEFVLAVRGGGSGDVTESHMLWKHPTKYTDHIVSPLVLDNQMVLVKGGGISSRFDSKSGESLAKPRRLPNSSDYFASPILGDNKIYLAGENGIVLVLNNSEKLEVLGKNDMGDSILGTPAIADGRLLIRTRSKLYCIGE